MTSDWPGLDVSLQAWVPMRIRELRDVPAAELQRIAVECSRRVGAQGDQLQYGGHASGDAWAELVTGLAALAILTPGGVTWRGMHWCAAAHEGCPLDGATLPTHPNGLIAEEATR
jgi:hypothetical protein